MFKRPWELTNHPWTRSPDLRATYGEKSRIKARGFRNSTDVPGILAIPASPWSKSRGAYQRGELTKTRKGTTHRVADRQGTSVWWIGQAGSVITAICHTPASVHRIVCFRLVRAEQAGLRDRWRLQMHVHPAEDQLARLVGHAVPPAVDVEGKVLRRLFQLVDIHDPQQGENALPLDEPVAVVQPGQVHKRPRRDERDDLVPVDGRQPAFEEPRADVLEVNVPPIAGGIEDIRIVAKERAAAIADRGLDPLVVGRQVVGAVAAKRMAQRADPVRIDLGQRLEQVDGDRVLVGEVDECGKIRMLMV